MLHHASTRHALSALTLTLLVASAAAGQTPSTNESNAPVVDAAQLPSPPSAPSGAQPWSAPGPAPYTNSSFDSPVAPPAEPDFNRWEKRPVAFEGVLSLGSPVGILGFAIDYAPTPMFVLNAGVGVGSGGPQVAVTPRFRIPLGNMVGIGVEGGMSGGPYEELCIMCGGEGRRRVPFALWANMGGGLDLRTGGGFHFRLFAGRSWLLNPGGCQNTETGAPCKLTEHSIPYVGMAFGGALSLW